MDITKELTQKYTKYFLIVYNFLLRRTNDFNLSFDLTQDTLLKSILKVNQFKEGNKVESWLFGIAHKSLIDYIRHQKICEQYDNEIKNILYSDNKNDKSSYHILLKTIYRLLIKKFNTNDIRIFFKIYIHDKSYQEVSLEHNISVNNLLQKTFKMREFLRIRLSNKFIEALPNIKN